MGFTRKVREDLERLVYDPALGYRVWPEPSVSYKQVSTQPRPHPAANEAAPDLTRQTLLGTCAFLFALLLVGFVAGFSMRGTAQASTGQSSIVSLAMSAVAAPSGLDVDSSRSSLVAAFGSEAPDELLTFNVAADDTISALVRVHGNSGLDTDQLSLVQINADGGALELSRLDALGLRAIDMTRHENGTYVLASLHPTTLDIRGLSDQGKSEWSRDLAIAGGHKANVKVVSTPLGTVIVGPSETPERVSLTYLGPDGELLWQRSLPAAAASPGLLLEANYDGSIFLGSRGPSDEGDVYSLMRIDAEGQDLWRTFIPLTAGENITGLVVAGDGGVYALATGSAPALTKYDLFGSAAWSVELPHAKFSNQIHVVANADGNAVIAVAYSIADEWMDVQLEERGQFGELIRETSLSLPSSSSLDAIAEASPGRYLLAGSILPSRFDDADIFVNAVAFSSMSSPSEMLAASMAVRPEPETIAATLPEPMIETAIAEVEPAPSSPVEAPRAAVLATADMAQEAPPSVVEVRRPQVAAIDNSVIQEAKVQAPVIDEANNRAAISRFVSADRAASTVAAVSVATALNTGEGVQAQCRFSCLEKDNPGAQFPMWRAIEAPQSAFSIGLPNVHELTCRAAGGARNPASKPDCQPS